AGDVAARSRQTRDDAGADGVSRHSKNDRDDRCRPLSCEDRSGVMRENDIDLEAHQFGGDLGETLATSLRRANLDRDVAAVDPTKLGHPPHKSGDPLTVGRRRARAQVPDHRHARLLRPRRDRPRSRAEQRDELAPFHDLIPPVLPTERIAHLSYGRSLLHCGISTRVMTAVGHLRQTETLPRTCESWPRYVRLVP